jgi:hypothetical protein
VAIDQTVYFGTPGTMISLPHPKGGVKTTRVRPTQQFALGNGEYRTRRLLHGSRLYTLSWDKLLYSTFATSLHAYDQGHMGPGPFAFLDPGQRNMLTVNQSAATALTNAVDNFTIAGSGQTIGSSLTVTLTTPRSLNWNFNATAPASGASTLTLDSPYAGWPGIPAVAARPLTFSFQAIGGGTDNIVTFQGELLWYSAAGSLLSTSTGTPMTTSGAAWTQGSVSATAPASTAYVQCRVHYVSGASFGSIVYFSAFMLNEGTTPDAAWTPGTGVLPVSVVSLAEAWPWLYAAEVRDSPDLVLRQDGR